MAKETEEQRYSRWAETVSRAEKSLDESVKEWDRYLDYYRLNIPDEKIPEGSVWVNYYFAFSRIILPSIYFRNPDVVISPRKPGIEELARAKVRERLLNYHIEEIAFEEEMRRIIFDAFHTSVGVMKFGYAPALQRKGRSVLLDDTSFESIFEDTDDTDLLSKFQDFQPDDRITDALPFAIRVPRRHFLVDELASTLKEARWVCHTILKPVDEIRKSKTYPRGLVSGIDGTHSLFDTKYLNEENPSGVSSIDRRNSRIQLVKIYEIWDKEQTNSSS